MLSIEAYKRFLLKINKNDTNSDIDISKGEFVLLYNEQKDRWLEEQIKTNESNISVLDIGELQNKHVPLNRVSDSDRYSIFSLPTNFFKYISSYSICSDNSCSDVIVSNIPYKAKNENMLLENSNFQPSLDYEETIVDLSGNTIYVYRKDFTIDKVFLNYYREVGKIDIAGYRKLDGTISTDVHPDVSDISVDEILNRCAKEVIRRYENPEGFQLASERIATE
jgi:hypothetical protein